jgi:hypothetical protein
LTEDIATTEIGQSVPLSVEEELKPEPGLVPTLLQLMVVQSVLETVPKLRPVTKLLVQVGLKIFYIDKNKRIHCT